MNHHKTAWADGGESKETCFQAVLDMAYIFFRPGEESLLEVSEEQLVDLSNQNVEIANLVRKSFELSEDQQKFMFEYVKQLSGNG